MNPTINGVPQGGIISPTLLVVTLSGLEKAIKAIAKPRDKIHVCIYADDFIVTGPTREVLQDKVQPVIENFLSERGLTLAQEKTNITFINEGFDFLGMNIRKYKDKLVIKPSSESVKRLLSSCRRIIKHSATGKTEDLLNYLNPKIRGWANYYRHVCSQETFDYVDNHIFKAIWRWAKRRHPTKSRQWIKERYFRVEGLRNWIFSTMVKDKHGEKINLDIVQASKVPIRRHIKIRAGATPFDPTYHRYFTDRILRHHGAKKSDVELKWWLCWWKLLKASRRKNE